MIMLMMAIQSVFLTGHEIPFKYTAVGENISPSLKFDNIPENAKSLVLIMDDPDAPQGTFDHWIVWNIPPSTHSLSDGAPELSQMSVKHGINHVGTTKYFGPKPPPGKPHRYFFKLYALDVPDLNLPEGSDKEHVEEKMKGHILSKAEIIGTYQNQSK